jgi:ABC-2 type transport system ATP-binding protein
MQADYVIEVKDVWKSFKTVQAVRGINLKIPAGQFIAILGPNGAGKTTLVEMIEGIRKPDKGEITIMGKTWQHNEDELHRIIGISLQETKFIDKLRVSETLHLFASFFDRGMDKVNEIFQLVGLEDKRKSYVVNLSGGQRQRLALGIALLNDPAILLLDEPTTGLDPNARREIWEIIRKLREKSGTSMILTTHYMEEAENLCDYIVIMDNGCVLKEGTLHQLLNDETDEKGRNIKLTNMECPRKTLDDLFISLTGRNIDE